METLTRLRQVGSVAVYKAQFEALSNRIKELSEKHKLSCFLSGLKDEIRLPVRMLNPQNLNAAFGLAKIQEEYLMASSRSIKSWVEGPKASILGPPPVPKSPRLILRVLRWLFRRFLLLRWMREGKRVCAITAMTSGL